MKKLIMQGVLMLAIAVMGIGIAVCSGKAAVAVKANNSKGAIVASPYNDPLGRLDFNGMKFDDDIEMYDYFELVSFDDIGNLFTWLEELRFDRQDEKDSFWIQENINKIMTKAIALGIMQDFLNPDKTRWGGEEGTHSKILVSAMEMLQNDSGKENVYNFFANNNSFSSSNLEEWVSMPDWQVSAGGEYIEGTHFYNVRSTFYNQIINGYITSGDVLDPSDNGAYYKNANDNFSRSARTRLEDHYSAALNAYKNGYTTEAVKWLGFAIHYLQDIGATPHTTGVRSGTVNIFGIGLALTEHPRFERFADEFYDVYAVSNYSERKYGTFADTFQHSTNSFAVVSASFYDRVDNILFNTDYYSIMPYLTSRYGPVLEEMIPLTIQYVAALMDQFYTDIKSWDNWNQTPRMKAAIRNGQEVQFVANHSGKYMDCKGANYSSGTVVQQYEDNGTDAQKFKAHYNVDDGSFSFSPIAAPNMRVSVWDRPLNIGYRRGELRPWNNDPNDKNIRKRFKVTYQDGLYRLMTGVSGYADIFRVEYNGGNGYYSNGQPTGELAFNPDSTGHYWNVIQKSPPNGNPASYSTVYSNTLGIIVSGKTTDLSALCGQSLVGKKFRITVMQTVPIPIGVIITLQGDISFKLNMYTSFTITLTGNNLKVSSSAFNLRLTKIELFVG